MRPPVSASLILAPIRWSSQWDLGLVMLSDEVMARLSQMTRTAPPPVRALDDAGQLAVHENLTIRREREVGSADNLTDGDLAKSDLAKQDLEGREVETPVGRHWLIERPIDELWPTYRKHLDRHEQRPRTAEARGWSHPHLECLSHGLPNDLLVLDLETCGFAGSMVFLVGALYQRDDQLWLAQWLARNYAEERAMLYSLWQVVPRKPLLVTFNGKSFDWPVIRDRTTLHRLCGQIAYSADDVESVYTQPGEHCDILHHARRHWKGRLPNFRLQTLERHVCGRRREGDIPGRLIPDAYHDFVRSGDPRQMRSILHHNALDLVTLLQLSLVLA